MAMWAGTAAALVLVALSLVAADDGPLYDSFTTYNASVWEYADKSLGTTDRCKVWYLKNHSDVDATLSMGEGNGLVIHMSSTPCQQRPDACGGAKMAADHLGAINPRLYGDYELRLRLPYEAGSDGNRCSDGVYAYFTAGFVMKGGVWNEFNFGFHPDRDAGGTNVSCEHHDDTGRYHETNVSLGFNARKSFNTFKISLRRWGIEWSVAHDGGPPRTLHRANATLTSPMTTRVIMRTNFLRGDPGFLPEHVFEISSFRFTPSDGG